VRVPDFTKYDPTQINRLIETAEEAAPSCELLKASIAMATSREEFVEMLARSYGREERNSQIRWQLEDEVQDVQEQRDDAEARAERFLRFSGVLLGVIALLCVVIGGMVIQ
jgi:hypothetical protein